MNAASLDNDLLHALASLDARVLTLGDLMLDVFAYGTATRISPEAPVPVMRMSRELRMLGGSGNVARNISALGGRALLVAPVGADESGDMLEKLTCDEPRIDARLVRCSQRRTTTKRRFIVAGQQMLRVDQEETKPLADTEEASLIEHALQAIGKTSVVVLSDYDKGAVSRVLLRRVIAAAREAGKPVFVDPKNPDAEVYRGATCIPPKAGALAGITGLPTHTAEQVVAAARALLATTDAEYVLATRSEKGLSLVPQRGEALHIATRRRDVFDVSGAGDTVMGTLALAVGSGVPWSLAAHLANIAAGIVVAKQGTETCSRDELELELSNRMLGLGAKLQSAASAVRLAGTWRRQGLRIGFTNGCFDLLHPGHLALLERARATCDRLIVGLNSDTSVARLKGPTRPLQNQAARAAVLAALAFVDLVVVFDEDTPLELITQLRPSVLLKGADYTLDQVVGAAAVLADGGEVKLVELVVGQSTTNIIRRMGP